MALISIGLDGMTMTSNGSQPLAKQSIGSNGFNGWKVTMQYCQWNGNGFWRDSDWTQWNGNGLQCNGSQPSKHLKGQLDPPVSDVTFLDQGGQLDPP